MPMIPQLTDPMTDELLLSFLLRLAAVNGMDSLGEFIAGFVYYRKDRKRAYSADYGFDTNDMFGYFLQAMPGVTDPVEFYLAHSIYPFMAPFMTRMQQAHKVNGAFRMDQFPKIITKNTGMIPELRYCPECMREDIRENGFFYYHTAHQLPNVHVCPVHHVPLIKYDGKPANYLDIDYLQSLESSYPVVTDASAEYAEYAKRFLEARFQIDIKEVTKAMYSALHAMHLQAADYTEYEKTIRSGKYGELFEKSIDNMLRTQLLSSALYADPAMCLAMLMILYPDIHDFHNAITENVITKDFLNAIGDEYTVFAPYRSTIIEVLHKECGKKTITTPAGFEAGWRCNHCDEGKTNQQKIEEIVQCAGKGQYELQSEFTSMNRKVALKHKTCGAVIHTTPRGFMEEGVRCLCESTLTVPAMQKLVPDNFEILDYKDEIVTVHCKDCGHTFDFNWQKFKLRPYCKICHPQMRTEDVFKNEIAEMGNGEYELVGHYVDKDTPVRIRHKVCGKIQEYSTPGAFLYAGTRCKYCAKKNRIITFTSVSKNRPSHIWGEQSADIYRIIRQNYSNTDLIFTDDMAHIMNKKIKSFDGRLSTLVNKGLLYRVGKGVYCITKRTVSDADMLNERYLIRNGKRIGMLYGESAAYELGIIQGKPDITYVHTNVESQLHGRLKDFGENGTWRITGYKIVIDDANYKYLTVLDMIRMCYHTGWEYQDALKAYIRENDMQMYDFYPFFYAFSENVQKRLEDLYKGQQS